MPFPWILHTLLPFGRSSEILAARFLRSQGYRLVASGFRVHDGEVDLIAWDSDVLAFVEVKALRSDALPEDAVTLPKRKRLARAAHAYIAQHRLFDAPYRFDIVAITQLKGAKPEIRLHRDAFRG